MELQQLIYLLYTHAQPILNSVGLVLDIFGAYLLVSEFRGQKYRVLGPGPLTTHEGRTIIDPIIEDTSEYKKWEKKKNCRITGGLALLTFGFFVQIVSNWIRFL